MPIANIAWVLEGSRRFCDQAGATFGAYPMHEVLHHPQAADVLRLFKTYALDISFEPIPTDGVALARRDDWQSLLEAAQACGTKTLWFAVHGIDEVHDRMVNCSGAYQGIITAVKRARAMGLRCGSNVFISRACLPQFRPLMDSLQAIGFDELFFHIANYYAHARERHYHGTYRPELEEALPYAEEIRQRSVVCKEQWASLSEHTEAAWYHKAMASGVDRKEWTFPLPTGLVELVVRPDLSAYRGIAGIYGTSYGNLRSDPIATVLGRAMADGETTDSLPLYFSAPSIPPPAEAAQKVGNPDGQKLYFHAADVYTRWLDLALEAYRRY